MMLNEPYNRNIIWDCSEFGEQPLRLFMSLTTQYRAKQMRNHRACVETMGNTPDHASEGEDIVQTTNRKGSESYSGKIKRGSLVQLQQGALQKKLAVRRVFFVDSVKHIVILPKSPFFSHPQEQVRWKR